MTNACWSPLASWASLSPRLDEAGVEQTAGGTQKGTQLPRQKTYTGGTQWTASQSQNEPLNSQERPRPAWQARVPGVRIPDAPPLTPNSELALTRGECQAKRPFRPLAKRRGTQNGTQPGWVATRGRSLCTSRARRAIAKRPQ